MAVVILFVLLLLSSFGVLLYFLKLTPTESAVEQHLESIKGSRGLAVAPDGTTILQQPPLSSNPIFGELLRRTPGPIRRATLLEPAAMAGQPGTALALSVTRP